MRYFVPVMSGILFILFSILLFFAYEDGRTNDIILYGIIMLFNYITCLDSINDAKGIARSNDD